MKTLSWNCRGLGNPRAVRALKKLLFEEQPSIVFLMETRLKVKQMEKLNEVNLHFARCLPVDCDGNKKHRSGGLCVLWNKETELDLISLSNHHLSFKVKGTDGGNDWIFTGIYGWPEQAQREKTWRLMQQITPTNNMPWMCAGDFNEIIWINEKKGGNQKAWQDMNNFRSAISQCHLEDLGYTGQPFTWTNGREGKHNIVERLDRALANATWQMLFPTAYVRHLPRYRSDHNPICIECKGEMDCDSQGKKRKKRFRFEHMWLHHPEFTNTLKDFWNQTSIASSYTDKAKHCGDQLLIWDALEFGSVRKKIKELQKQMTDLQNGPQTEENINKHHELEIEMDRTLVLEESLWHQRSRVLWLKDGDRNSKFFHQKATQRSKRNTIKKLKIGEKQWTSNRKEIEGELNNYFSKLFKSDGERDLTSVVDKIESKVPAQMNESLMRPFTAEEVLRAVRQMHPSKAPGPDEGFSTLLEKAQRDGHIHGVKVARSAPEISHLFFADDTILFTRATIPEADILKKIISDYEMASGQRINLDKTELTVSANITQDRHLELSNRLGVQRVESHEKYLGLPTIIGRSKRKIFDIILERVVKKMKDWKERTLSKAGKETLIKAVIQATPTYVMNCFLLPITLCQDIERATAKFFWGGTDTTYKCHWVSWDRLTQSKADGGLGFREIHHFNMALLAKQVWSLLNNPSSTIFKILKARYFPNGSFLQAGRGHNPSYLWRSLWNSFPLVEAGMGWRVGNGRDICIREDRWIGLTNQRRPGELYNRNDTIKNVAALIDEHTYAWNSNLIQEIFNEDDSKEILTIPLSAALPADKRIWRPSKSGKFSVRTAYHLAVQMFSKRPQTRASPSAQVKLWKQIWKIKLLPRISCFIWRACIDSLPTLNNLARRGFNTDPICNLCGEDMESLDHILFKCEVTSRTWLLSPLRLDVKEQNFPSFKTLLWTFIENGTDDATELLCYTVWSIWNGRNKSIFDNTPFCQKKTADKAHSLWMEATASRRNPAQKAKETDDKPKWQPPPDGIAKLNTDVAVLPNEQISMGFILRDHRGKVLCAGNKRARASGSTTLLEGLALRFALQTLMDHEWPPIQIESDSKILIDNLNGAMEAEMYSDIVTGDILKLGTNLQVISFKHTRRSGNTAAHNIARAPEFICFGDFPSSLNHLIASDVT